MSRVVCLRRPAAGRTEGKPMIFGDLRLWAIMGAAVLALIVASVLYKGWRGD